MGESRVSPFSLAPVEEGLGSYSQEGKRRWIEPVVSPGRYLTRRRLLGYPLIAIFLAAPHIQVAGYPAIFLDISNRLFHIFGVTLHPTDNLILVAFGLFMVLSLFLFTALFGRIWCGYGCPQPVYLELVFRPIETLIEGPARSRLKARGLPATPSSRLRKVLKWAVYLVIASILAHTFVSYFVGWSNLWDWTRLPPARHFGVFGITQIVTLAMTLDFSWFRENFCTMFCPYGRLQTVLYDKDTRIVGYDAQRGEPRGKAGQVKGDCIDCHGCVATCPTGIDIRRGLQMECIGCAQCIDACDTIMDRVKKPRGLIRYTSLNELSGGKTNWFRRRVLAYSVLWTTALCTLLFLLSSRALAEVDILRAGLEPYRETPSGEVANQLRLRITNLQDEPQSFQVELLDPPGTIIVGQNPFTVAPQQVETLNVVATLARDSFKNGRVEARIRVRGDAGFERTSTLLLLGPYR